MRQKLLFIGHGSPMTLIEDSRWTDKWEKLSTQIHKPRAILMISAHWFINDTLIQKDDNPSMIYDMYGFPKEMYEIVYPAKTNKELIEKIKDLLGSNVKTSSRGYDHGCYAPLLRMYPEADIPVVQLSINAQYGAETMMKVGELLRPLRDENILIIGSGNIVHNLSIMDYNENVSYPECKIFDDTIEKAVIKKDTQTLINWQSIIGASQAAKYHDHLSPIFYIVGAMHDDEPVEVFNKEVIHGSLSMTSYIIG